MSILLCRFRLGGGIMERLTEKQSSGYDLKAMNGEWCNKYCEQQRVETCNECVIYQAIQKLAEYENAEEQGLLLRLPCKVGDTIYEVSYENREFVIKEHIVNEFIYRAYRFPRIEIYCENENGFLVCNNIGKLDECLFLTKAEAEQKLKEMESD